MQQISKNKFVSPTTAATADFAKLGILFCIMIIPGATIMKKMIISFIFSIGLFVALPTGIASIFKNMGASNLALNLIEAFIRISILIGYMYVISKMKDIYRLFQYHGAEHKTIFCYESMEELTVENVRKQPRLHPRCGTNFMFLIMFVSIVIFSCTGWGGIVERLLLRIILIPVVTGISYELIKWLGKSDNSISWIKTAITYNEGA